MSVVSAIEQWLLELTNRARLDPEAMAQAFAIDLNAGLPPGTITATAKQPLAMSDILFDTSDFHGAWVLENNSFGTYGYLGSNPGDRMAYAGFNDGAAFNWSENIGWRDFEPMAGIMESSVAYTIWRELFLDPQARAALLAEDLNETGISFVNGPIGDVDRKGYVMTQDMGASDSVFVTGGAYSNSMFDTSLGLMPDGVAGVAVVAASDSSVTNAVGGYRLEVEAGRQQVRIGDIRVLVPVGDENIKLDLIGDSALRSSHSVAVVSGASYAELIGIADAALTAGAGAGAIYLHGNKGDNQIRGNGFANGIDGGLGDDMMWGGGGDDTYVVDSWGDRVIEGVGQGYDRVSTTVSFRLGATSEVELVYATHDILWDEIDLTGNRFAQELRGNYGDNVLDGRGGGDILAGYNGDDVYIIRHSADQIVDWADGGHDRLRAAVSFVLADDDEIEVLETINADATSAISLTGNDTDQILRGNAGRNTLRGEGGNDVLFGYAGNDTLIGGAGTDVMEGGAGNDRFVFEAPDDSAPGTGRDVIRDWEAVDRIDLSAFGPALSFVGETTNGAPLGAGQVAYFHNGSSTFVVANTDADPEVDFQLRLMGIHDLAPNDFVLV